MEKQSLALLEEKIAWIEKQGHGEVIVKIKNGVIYRILTTQDELMADCKVDNPPKSVRLIIR